MIAGVDDLLRIFKLVSEADKRVFSELSTLKSLSGCLPHDPSISAALMVSTIKSLAAQVNSLIKISNNNGNNDVLISTNTVALCFVKYQKLKNLPSTMVQIIEEQCSDMVNNFEAETKVNLYRYFLTSCYLNATSVQYVSEFEKLLSHALTFVCSNIQRNLEDLMDFDFLWDASTDGTLVFGGDSLVADTAKQFTWILSRTPCLPQIEDGADVLSCKRSTRILHQAACMDLVLASILTQSYNDTNESSEPKRIRTEREVRQYLLNAVGELLKHVASAEQDIVIERNDINIAAQKVAKNILPFIEDQGKMDFEEKLISAFSSCISSHKQRQACVVRLKGRQRSIVIEEARKVLSRMSPHQHNIERAIQMGRHLSSLRERTLDHCDGVYQLDSAERMMLAPVFLKHQGVESNGTSTNGMKHSMYEIQAICYAKQAEEQIKSSPVGTLSTAHISGWKDPPLSDMERDELQKWISSLSSDVTPDCTLSPSSRLMAYLKASSFPPPAQANGNVTSSSLSWEKVMLPVLNCCLSRAAADFGTSSRFTISQNGDHAVPSFTFNQDQMIMPSVILRFYFAALDTILHHDAARRKKDANSSLVLNSRVHSSLFALCRFCIHKASHLIAVHQDDFLQNTEDQLILIEDIGTCPVVYCKLIDSFLNTLAPRSKSTTSSYEDLLLPSRIIKCLHRLQEMFLGFIWMQCMVITCDIEPTFVGMINHLKRTPTVWRQVCPIDGGDKSDEVASINGREHIFVRYALRNLVKITRRRILALCALLLVPESSAVASKTMVVFTNMLYHRVDMFIDRNPDQVMICSLYLVCSKMKLAPSVSLQKIKDTYIEMNKTFFTKSTLNAILHEIKLSANNDESGNILSFYNKVFVPNVCPFWKSFVGEAPDKQ